MRGAGVVRDKKSLDYSSYRIGNKPVEVHKFLWRRLIMDYGCRFGQEQN